MTPDLIFLRSDPSTRSLRLTIGNGPTSYQKSDFCAWPSHHMFGTATGLRQAVLAGELNTGGGLEGRRDEIEID